MSFVGVFLVPNMKSSGLVFSSKHFTEIGPTNWASVIELCGLHRFTLSQATKVVHALFKLTFIRNCWKKPLEKMWLAFDYEAKMTFGVIFDKMSHF